MYAGKQFLYWSEHDVRNQEEFVQLLKQRFAEGDGVCVCDIKDAYPTVMEDLKALKASGRICQVRNADLYGDVVYPRDDLRVPDIRVDDRLKKLFRSIEVPSGMPDFLREKNRMKSSKRTIMAQNDNVLNKPEQKKMKTEITKC